MTDTCTTCGRPADPHPYRHPITRITQAAAGDLDIELRAAALQLPVEFARGIDIADREIRAGRFSDARASLAMLRGLVETQEAVIRKLITKTQEAGR